MSREYNHIDTHAHLNFDQFDDDRAAVIKEMQTEAIGAINVGVDVPTSAASIELAKAHNNIWASVGCHPTEATAAFDIDLYSGLIEKSPETVVAVGECGFDYYRKAHRGDKEKSLQREVFEAQLKLAVKKELPLILHMRPREHTMDAYEDGLKLLEYYGQKYGDKLRGTAHFFVGDDDIARRFLDLGFFISATGVATLNEELQRVFSDIPTSSLIAETDAPFAAPSAQRGQRNSPLYVPQIVSCLSDLKEVPEEELSQQIISNTERLFSL